MWRFLMVVVAVGACQRVDSEQVECAGGRVCPAEYTCTSFGCASPEQVEACDGLATDDACTTSRGDGVCIDAACAVRVCGNDIVEPREACDDGNTVNGDGCNGTCTSDETCGNGIAELAEACDCGDAEHPGGPLCRDASNTLTINGGAICSDTCTPRRCGDGVIDPGELCDDGNAVAGDGCSFDCRSQEICGNGILDYFAGERCDDANTRDRDGCDGACLEELPRWRQHALTTVPPGRNGAAIAYDSARRRWVTFGGQVSLGNVNATALTWELSSTTWEQRTFDTTPFPRMGAAMAYDPVRGRIVMFGGVTYRSVTQSGIRYDDTWEYDGVAWRPIATPTSPSARMYAAMAYDGVRGKVVLFGGFATGFLDDAWEYDGTTWTPIAITGTKPAGRDRSGLAFDPINGRLVLYGGVGQGDVTLGDTWALAGTTWTNLNLTLGARSEHAMAYDTVAGRVVLYGGRNGSTYYGDVQELSTAWAARTTNTAPAGRAAAAVASDPVTGRLLVAHGYNASGVLTDASILTAATWAAAPTTAPVPSGRFEHALVYDARRARLVMLGNGSGGLETWTFDGQSWKNLNLAPGNLPTARSTIVMAYDAGRDRIVLFGGETSLTDTWEFDGSVWQLRAATTPPSGRFGHAMTYDPVRRRVVLFGGKGNGGDPFAETWEYDGQTASWAPITTTTVPPKRRGHAMTYDIARQRVVMFGGNTDGERLDDTWEYDGTNWTARASADTPFAREGHALVYDMAQNKVVLNGGNDGNSPALFLGDTWVLEASGWRRLAPSLVDRPTPSRAFAAAAYDAARNQVVLHGGLFVNQPLDDTWILSILPTAADEVCTAGQDVDGDTTVGCGDSECFGTCAPYCPPTLPAAMCATAVPRCGDGTCTESENCRNCAADCAVGNSLCPVRCGDAYCDSTEALATCPGDCTP